MGANAQTSVPAFTSGQVLTAAQVTQINTGIPVFASSTERDAAFGGTGEKTLAEGQMAYLEDTNATQYYDGSSWAAVAGGKILQVVSTAKTDTFSTTSSTFTDVTGLTASITPTSATSKILVTAQVSVGVEFRIMLRLNGGNSNVYVGDGGPSSSHGVTGNNGTSTASGYNPEISLLSHSMVYLDSPATTSSTTYAVQITNVGTGTVYVNRSEDGSRFGASSITLMEVSA